MNLRLRSLRAGGAVAVTAAVSFFLPLVSSHAAPPAKNATKGQAQMAGADGKFGTIYTLKSGFNTELLDARYTLEPLDYTEPVYPAKDQKMMIVDIAVKNVNDKDTELYTNNTYMSAFDAQGNETKNAIVTLASRAEQGGDPMLKPGQGVGQTSTHDPLRAVFLVPAKARIVKLILNFGRKGSSEDVVRYYIAGATKEEAGKAGDPANIIAPLPAVVQDPADPTGASTPGVIKAPASGTVFSGPFAFHLDSFTYTSGTDVTDDNRAPDDGQQYAVATITATGLTVGKNATLDHFLGDQVCVSDADGNLTKSRYRVSAHSGSGMDFGRVFKKGASYTFRYVFAVPKAAPLKTLEIGISDGRRWEYDISSAK